MSKTKIEFTRDNKDYVLEFTADSLKKMEKQGKKLEKQFSATSVKTVTTVQEGTENYGEVQEASMPMGVIICLCASLVICLASAWFYRRSQKR